MSTESRHALENQVRAKWASELCEWIISILLLLTLKPLDLFHILTLKSYCRGGTVCDWVYGLFTAFLVMIKWRVWLDFVPLLRFLVEVFGVLRVNSEFSSQLKSLLNLLPLKLVVCTALRFG